MTISTYTEPQPVNIISDEPPKAQEIEEDVEAGSFAKLLAGLLQKAKIDESDIEAEDFSAGEEGIQLFSLQDTDRIAFDNPVEESTNIEDSKNPFTEKDFSEVEVPEEQASFLLSAEQLLINSDNQIIGDEESGGFLQEVPQIETQDFVLAEQDVDFSSLKPEAAVADVPVQEAAETVTLTDGGMELAVETAVAQESIKNLPSDINEKKERSFSKDAKIETKTEGVEEAALRKEPEKAGQSKLDEARGRRRDKVTIDVRDQRTDSNVSNNTQTRVNVVETVSSRHAQGDAPVREITLELRVPEGQTPQAQTTWEVKSGNALENMLARELHQNFNGDIVRHASMALRDGGEATIRVALKPDSLGNVKIHLELTENKITGRIFVDSEEALNAFRKEIASLEQAFRDSGFTNADLNLSLAADNNGQEQETDLWAPRNAASQYDSSFDSVDQVISVDVLFGHRPGSIDMFA